jgi:hypothetical protein
VRRRIGVVSAAALVAIAISGLGQFGLPSREDVLPPIGLIFILVWIGLPFVPVVVAASHSRTNNLTVGIAFAVAVACTFIVHRVVENAIEDNPSSTAALAHIYDPVIGCLAVGSVLTAAWVLRATR